MYVCVMQFNAAAAAFNWLDISCTHGRGADGCPAAAESAAADSAATVFCSIIQRLLQFRCCQPRTDADDIGRRSAGHVVKHRRAWRSTLNNSGNNVKCVGFRTSRQQPDVHGSRHVVCYVDERYARLTERTDKHLQGQTLFICLLLCQRVNVSTPVGQFVRLLLRLLRKFVD